MPAPLQDSYIERALSISTQHVPSEHPDFGSVRALEYEFGWIVFAVDPEFYTDAELPQWLRYVMEYASEREFSLIRFDGDSLTLDDLPTYDWE